VDTVSPDVRSEVMARVRSRRNRSTEWRLRGGLIQARVRGWKLNAPDIFGKPDFAFQDKRVLVFVDGCYWHGCPKCYRRPSSNTAYWDSKVERNRARDVSVNSRLRAAGWRVLRIWEHQLTDIRSVISKVKRLTGSVDPAMPSSKKHRVTGSGVL